MRHAPGGGRGARRLRCRRGGPGRRVAVRYPDARRASSASEILEDDAIQLVASAAIPDERGPLGVAAMRHGKDFRSDKPAFTALEMLEEARRVQRATRRNYAICYGERVQNTATVKSVDVHAGVLTCLEFPDPSAPGPPGHAADASTWPSGGCRCRPPA